MEYGVDFSTWGQGNAKSVYDLIWERKQGQVEMRWDPANKRLTRYTRQLRIKLFAITQQKGECVLVEKAEMEGGKTKTAKNDKYMTKRMNLNSTWQEEATKAIEKDLGLDQEEQARHLEMVNHVLWEEQQPAYSYPGLFTVYAVDEVHFWIRDPEMHQDRLGLPSGSDFVTTTWSKQNSCNKEQYWQWKKNQTADGGGRTRRQAMQGKDANYHAMLNVTMLVSIEDQIRFSSDKAKPRNSVLGAKQEQRKSALGAKARTSALRTGIRPSTLNSSVDSDVGSAEAKTLGISSKGGNRQKGGAPGLGRISETRQTALGNILEVARKSEAPNDDAASCCSRMSSPGPCLTRPGSRAASRAEARSNNNAGLTAAALASLPQITEVRESIISNAG